MTEVVVDRAYTSRRWSSFPAGTALSEVIEDRLCFAEQSSKWYRDKKKSKRRMSILSRAVAVALATVGGIVPILNPIIPSIDVRFGYLFLVFAAAFALLDRVFGWSRNWSRYMISATQIEARAELYRVRSLALISCENPNKKEIYRESEEFTSAISEIIALETGNWDKELVMAIAEVDRITKPIQK